MAKKTTTAKIRQLVELGVATDLTKKSIEAIEKIRKSENGFDCIAYYMDINGNTKSRLSRGYKTKKLYCVLNDDYKSMYLR